MTITKAKEMSEVSAASQIATIMRQQTANAAKTARVSVKPEHIAGKMGISSHHSGGSTAAMQFDATGQVVPSVSKPEKGSATASFADLLN